MTKALAQRPLPALARPSAASETLQVLQMVENGRLSPAQALQLIAALKAPASPAPQVQAAPQTLAAPSLPGWRRWWRLPLLGGGLVTGMGTLLMIGAFEAGGVGFWFVGAALVFLGGVGLAALALAGRSVRWLHLRVRLTEDPNAWPRTIAISLPLPLRLAAWLLHTCGPLVPQWADRGWDEWILALAESTSGDNPLYVEVDEGPGGERVQLLIG